MSEGFTSNKSFKKYLKYKTIFYNSTYSGNLESRNLFELGFEREGENKYSLTLGWKGLAWLFQTVKADLGTEYDENNGFFKAYDESNKILAYGKLNENFSQISYIPYDGEKVFGLRLKKEELVLLDTLSQKLKVLLNFDPKLGISEFVEALYISILAYGIEEKMESVCKVALKRQTLTIVTS